MRAKLLTSLLVTVAVLSPTSVSAIEGTPAGTFTLIANPSVKVKEVSRADLSNMFLKRRLSWSPGLRVIPVDQPLPSPTRQAFSTRVHKKNATAVSAFWEQQIFSGADIPPRILSSDAEVVAFVRSTVGAVGYVSARADLSGVVVLEIVE